MYTQYYEIQFFLLSLPFHFNSLTCLLYLYVKREKEGHTLFLKLHFYLIGLQSSLDGKDTWYACRVISLFVTDTSN